VYWARYKIKNKFFNKTIAGLQVMKTFILYFITSIILLCPSTTHAQTLTTATNYPIVLSTFQTTYGDYGRYHGRARNIRVAAELVSGIVLQPNERFSFNEVVGERTRENNFSVAPVIGSGRLRSGIGGGVCQLASTIYAAALYSGMNIIEHHQHSRISRYISPGLDATVDWGTKDLVFENPYSFPVVLFVSILPGRLPAEQAVKVTFLAPRHGYEVNVYFNRRINARANTIEEVEQSIPLGQRHVVETGTPRVQVTMRRRITNSSNGTETLEQNYMVYPASDRIFQVSP